MLKTPICFSGAMISLYGKWAAGQYPEISFSGIVHPYGSLFFNWFLWCVVSITS